MTFSIRAAALCAATGLTTLAAPAFAQDRAEKPAYYQSGPWLVRDISPIFCTLDNASPEAGRLRLYKSSTESAYFGFRLNTAKEYNTSSFGIEWLFDEEPINGRLLAGRNYQVRNSDSSVEALFRKAETLTIKHQEETVVTINLKGSAAAFRKLKECADQYPGSSVPVMPPPAPAAFRRPRQSQDKPVVPISRNRPTPVQMDAWIGQDDWKQLPVDLFKVDLAVGYILTINTQGEVERCMITRSSGAYQVDQLTCDLLKQRAGFVPQTDENGKAVRAQFTGNVRWKAQEPLKESVSD